MLGCPGIKITDEEDFNNVLDLNKEVDRKIKDQIERIREGQTPLDLDPESRETIKIEKSKDDHFFGAQCGGLKGETSISDICSISYISKNKNDYLICAKSDGVRYLMFILSNGEIVFSNR